MESQPDGSGCVRKTRMSQAVFNLPLDRAPAALEQRPRRAGKAAPLGLRSDRWTRRHFLIATAMACLGVIATRQEPVRCWTELTG